MPNSNESLSLEGKLDKISEIVEKLDKADAPLEELIKVYAIGIEYAKSAKDELDDFEQKITDITNKFSTDNGEV